MDSPMTYTGISFDSIIPETTTNGRMLPYGDRWNMSTARIDANNYRE
jgi:hypothetical protein